MRGEGEAIRVLICDNHPMVRAGLRAALQEDGGLELVAEAKDGAEAVSLVGDLRPDVVLMDLRMPRMDGVTATTRIKALHPKTEVVVLTAYDGDIDIFRALEEGAIGYLLKDADDDAIFAAVRKAVEGTASLDPNVQTRLVRSVRQSNAEAISFREVEILQLVAKGLSNEDIAETLYLTRNTVKTHLQRAYEKLGATDRTSAVIEALRRGIIRLEP